MVDFAGKFSEFSSEGSDVGRKAMAVRRMAKPMQDSFTALEKVHMNYLFDLCCDRTSDFN